MRGRASAWHGRELGGQFELTTSRPAVMGSVASPGMIGFHHCLRLNFLQVSENFGSLRPSGHSDQPVRLRLLLLLPMPVSAFGRSTVADHCKFPASAGPPESRITDFPGTLSQGPKVLPWRQTVRVEFWMQVLDDDFSIRRVVVLRRWTGFADASPFGLAIAVDGFSRECF